MIEVKQGQMFHDKVHLSSKVCMVPYVMVRNICFYIRKMRANVFSVAVIKIADRPVGRPNAVRTCQPSGCR
jgi:hypothetical protein